MELAGSKRATDCQCLEQDLDQLDERGIRFVIAQKRYVHPYEAITEHLKRVE